MAFEFTMLDLVPMSVHAAAQMRLAAAERRVTQLTADLAGTSLMRDHFKAKAASMAERIAYLKQQNAAIGMQRKEALLESQRVNAALNELLTSARAEITQLRADANQGAECRTNQAGTIHKMFQTFDAIRMLAETHG